MVNALFHSPCRGAFLRPIDEHSEPILRRLSRTSRLQFEFYSPFHITYSVQCEDYPNRSALHQFSVQPFPHRCATQRLLSEL